MHRLDLGLYSHPKGIWGNGVRTHVELKGSLYWIDISVCGRVELKGSLYWIDISVCGRVELRGSLLVICLCVWPCRTQGITVGDMFVCVAV